MDLLKKVIEEKKRDVNQLKESAPLAKSKWIPRREIEKKRREETLADLKNEERKRKLEELERFARLESCLDAKKRLTRDASRHLSETASSDASSTERSISSLKDQALGPPPVPRDEVVRRLRRRNQVVTFFGETDWQRYNRLCQIEITEHDDDLMEGQKNVFLQLLSNKSGSTRRGAPHPGSVHARGDDDEFEEEEEEECRTAHHSEKNRSPADHSSPQSVSDSGGTVDPGSARIGSEPVSSGRSSEEVVLLGTDGTKDQESCIRIWIRQMLRLWEAELDGRSEEEKQSNMGKVTTAQYRQTWKDLRPLLKKLKHKEMDANVLNKIYGMVVCCQKKDYKAAHDKYIELSIGNAAWPMGVTMVGIHERAGRSKIFTSEIAHILNDETTRKYIHMFKRLMSLAQRWFPTDPSAMVTLSTTHV